VSKLLKNILLLSFLVFFSTGVTAQLDRNQAEETDVFQYRPDSPAMEFSPLPADPNSNRTQTVTPFGSLQDIADRFPTYSVIPNQRRAAFQGQRETEKDVLVKQYWNGKDVSQQKITTSLELGKFETETDRIKIVCRDHSYVDGDRVKLYVNEQVIRRSITLEGGYYSIDIDLRDGFNRIDIEALNQGSSGPNTAEFKVFDANGKMLASREWNILTGYVATLVVMKN